jgi:ribosomal protein S14
LTEQLTRRQLRELERSGQLPAPSIESEMTSQSEPEPTFRVEPQDLEQSYIAAATQVERPVQMGLSRRELRELERKGQLPEVASEPEVSRPTTDSIEITLPDVDVEDEKVASAELEQIVESDFSALDLPPADFTGTNLLAEPSTQSIVLEVAPEAIALPIETGEIAITGSITVLTDPGTGSLTGGLDGIELDAADRHDAVTGVISIVEPVSALEIINQRVNVGVVPRSVLRKGWWRPWVMGVAGVIMAVAAIVATITILNALGA